MHHSFLLGQPDPERHREPKLLLLPDDERPEDDRVAAPDLKPRLALRELERVNQDG